MKNIIKKIWWIFLVPIGILVLSYVFRKDTSELKEIIKHKKEELKVVEKEIKTEEESNNDKEEKLDKSVGKVKETIDKNLDNKEDRDEEAKKFFPDI